MKVGANFLVGLANSIWSALIGFAVVPFYLKYLGVEAYGLIGFFVTTQAVLSLLDMGMAPTINREVARYSALGNLPEAGKLLHTLAVVYWAMAAVIALFVLMLAPLIAEYWLQSKKLPPLTISHSVMLIGLVVACRWPIGLYQGALIGAQRLTVSSSINMAMGTLGGPGAVAVLAFVSPTIEAFFLWQAFVGILYAITIRWAAWRIVGRYKQIPFDVQELKRVWRFSAGLSAISLMGIIFTQMDKILLSKILGLEEFSHYMIATVIVSSLYILVAPMYNIAYPRFSALVASGDNEALGIQYRLFTRALSIVLFPTAMVLNVFSKELVWMWTGNLDIALAIAPVISLLAIGSALNGVMFIPHALQLAFGMTRLPLIINGVLMIALFPLIVIFAIKYGALGGAMAWMVLHVLYVLFGTWLTHRNLLVGFGKRWLFNDVGVPLCLALMGGFLASYICQEGNNLPDYIKLVVGAGIALLAIAIGLFLSPQLSSLVFGQFRNRNTIDALKP